MQIQPAQLLQILSLSGQQNLTSPAGAQTDPASGFQAMLGGLLGSGDPAQADNAGDTADDTGLPLQNAQGSSGLDTLMPALLTQMLSGGAR